MAGHFTKFSERYANAAYLAIASTVCKHIFVMPFL